MMDPICVYKLAMCRICLLLVATQLLPVLAIVPNECQLYKDNFSDYDRNPRYRINTTIECGDGLTVGYETEEEYEAAVGFNNVNNRIEMYVNCTDIYGNVTKFRFRYFNEIEQEFSDSDLYSEPGATCVVYGCFDLHPNPDEKFYSIENSSCTFNQTTEPPPETTTIEMVNETSTDITATTIPSDAPISSTRESDLPEQSIAPSDIPSTVSQTTTTVINSTPTDKVSPSGVSTQEAVTSDLPKVIITPSTITSIPITSLTTSQTMPTMISTPSNKEQTPTSVIALVITLVILLLLLLLMVALTFILVKAHQRYRLKHSRIYYTDCSEEIDPYFSPIDINAEVKTAVSVISIFDVYNPYLPVQKEHDMVDKETLDDDKSVILQATNPIEEISSAKSMIFEEDQTAITTEDSVDGDINSDREESKSVLSMNEYEYDSPNELQCEEEEKNDLALPLNDNKRAMIVSSGYVSSLDDAAHQSSSSSSLSKEAISPRTITSGYITDSRNLTGYNVSIPAQDMSEPLDSSISYVRVSDGKLVQCTRQPPSSLTRNCRDDRPLSLDTRGHKYQTQLSTSSGYITETSVSTPSSTSESMFSASVVSADHDIQTDSPTFENGQSYQTIVENMQGLFERGYTMSYLPNPVQHSLPVEDTIVFTEDDAESTGGSENDPIESIQQDHYTNKSEGLESDKLFADNILAECSLSLNPLHFEPIEFENGYESDHMPTTTPPGDSDVTDNSELNVYKWIPSLLTSSEAR